MACYSFDTLDWHLSFSRKKGWALKKLWLLFTHNGVQMCFYLKRKFYSSYFLPFWKTNFSCMEISTFLSSKNMKSPGCYRYSDLLTLAFMLICCQQSVNILKLPCKKSWIFKKVEKINYSKCSYGLLMNHHEISSFGHQNSCWTFDDLWKSTGSASWFWKVQFVSTQ